MRMLSIVAGLLLLACTADERATAGAASVVRNAPAAEAGAAAPLPGDSVLYLDVRTPAEWRAGHVAGAVLIPIDQLEQRWREIEAWRERPVVVYCRTGRRAGLAIEVLGEQGFTRLTNGVSVQQMAARGLPIVVGD